MIRILRQELKGRSEAMNEYLRVEQVSHVHDWDTWLGALGVTFYNSFKTRKSIPIGVGHSFCYRRRSGLAPSELARVAAHDRDGDPDDVFVTVKGRMVDEAELSHPPVLVLPRKLVQDRLLDVDALKVLLVIVQAVMFSLFAIFLKLNMALVVM